MRFTFAPLITYRIRVGWLDWLNAIHWTDWYEIQGLAERHLSGVPVVIAGQVTHGITLTEDMRSVRQHFSPNGRYIPPHRIVAVDWEELTQ